MKPVGHDKRPRDWIPFVNFAMVENVPESLKLRDHLFPFEGAQPDPELLWGVYGTTSINAAIFGAASYAAAKRCQSLQITSWYLIENFRSVTTQLTRDVSREAGYLHLGRLNAAFRDDIKATWLEWLETDSAAQFQQQQSYSLEDLALHHPEYIWRMFKLNKDLHMVIHPVRPEYSAASSLPVWIATVRATPSRVMASEVRFIPDVKVEP